MTHYLISAVELTPVATNRDKIIIKFCLNRTTGLEAYIYTVSDTVIRIMINKNNNNK